jgi:hypothetical protein
MTPKGVMSHGQVPLPGRQISSGMLKRIVLRGVFLVGATFAMTPPPPVDADPWFKCEPGYTFRANGAGTAAHCRKWIGDKTKNLRCPSTNFMGRRIGTTLRVKSGRDKCRGTLRIAGITNYTEVDPLDCGPQGAGTAYEYKMDHHGNADKCVMFRLDGFFLNNGWAFKIPDQQEGR